MGGLCIYEPEVLKNRESGFSSDQIHAKINPKKKKKKR